MKQFFYVLLAIIVLAGICAAGYWFIVKNEVGVSGSEAEGLEGIRPRNMEISEVGRDYFIVEWEVANPVSGYVKYGDTSNAITLIAQDVEGVIPSYQHVVRVSGLTSGKKYYFWVMSDEVAFGRSGSALEVLTLSE